MEAVEGTVAPSSGRRWGVVLGISALAVGAVVVGPRLVDAKAVTAAEGTVTCAISPVIEFSKKLTNSGDDSFKATLLAGTVACADSRAGADNKLIGATYAKESFDAKGNCAAFSLDKADVTVDWLVLGGDSVKSKVTVSDLDGSGTKPPAVAVEDGPLKDWQVTSEVNDLTAMMAANFKEACDGGKGVDKTATSLTLVFAPAGANPPSDPTGQVPPYGP